MSRRWRAGLLGLGIALVAHLVMAGWVWAVRDQLPARVATHWGWREADGFTDRGDLWHLLALGLGFSLLLGIGLVALMPRHGSGLAMAAGITAGTGVFLAVVVGVSIIAQAGAGAPVPFAWWWLVVGVAAALLLGWGANALVGRATRPLASTVPDLAQGLPSSDTTRSWHQQLSLLGLWRWRLTIDRRGLLCRSNLGGRIHLDLGEIECAETLEQVHAFEYGGMGRRLTRQGERLVTGTGPGLRLLLSDGTDFVVTTPQAEQAARLLNTLLREQRG